MFLIVTILLTIFFNPASSEAKEWRHVFKNAEGSYSVWDEIEGNEDFKNIIIKIAPFVTAEYDHALVNIIFNMQNKNVKVLSYSIIRTNAYQGKASARKNMKDQQNETIQRAIKKMPSHLLQNGRGMQIIQEMKTSFLYADQQFEKEWDEKFYATGGVEQQIVDSNIFTPIIPGSIIEQIYDFIE